MQMVESSYSVVKGIIVLYESQLGPILMQTLPLIKLIPTKFIRRGYVPGRPDM